MSNLEASGDRSLRTAHCSLWRAYHALQPRLPENTPAPIHPQVETVERGEIMRRLGYSYVRNDFGGAEISGSRRCARDHARVDDQVIIEFFGLAKSFGIHKVTNKWLMGETGQLSTRKTFCSCLTAHEAAIGDIMRN